jgi:hypothetical protein
MKKPLRKNAASDALCRLVDLALTGQPLPTHRDEGFKELAEAVASLSFAKEFNRLGAATLLALGKHVGKNLEEHRREAAAQQGDH